MLWSSEYQEQDKLHILEVATLFGATQAYFMRGYKEILSINTFPCEIFTEEEVNAYIEYFGEDKKAMILETLEYPYLSIDIAKANNPDIVKIDRTLLTDIDKDKFRQIRIKEMIDTFHAKKMNVVAEGIETEAEFNTMKELGADFFQGYYLGMPE